MTNMCGVNSCPNPKLSVGGVAGLVFLVIAIDIPGLLMLKGAVSRFV
jgi:hypothetical protein